LLDTVLNVDKLETKAVSSIESALQGEVSGISVVSSGGPGTSPTVRIRGIGSVNFASDPLYVIDGVPVGSLNNFDIKDMESVTVLKDAASAAIYGSRAANGVVLITTKRGSRNGKMTLSIDASTGFQQAWNKLDLLNSSEYIQFSTD
jgi:TonB-dependent SusC/RagA subfamily outer membrane receptor